MQRKYVLKEHKSYIEIGSVRKAKKEFFELSYRKLFKLSTFYAN